MENLVQENVSTPYLQEQAATQKEQAATQKEQVDIQKQMRDLLKKQTKSDEGETPKE